MEKQIEENTVVFFTVAKQYVFKITVGLLRRSEFRGVEGQGTNWSCWPFQAEKKLKKKKSVEMIGFFIVRFEFSEQKKFLNLSFTIMVLIITKNTNRIKIKIHNCIVGKSAYTSNSSCFSRSNSFP